MSSDTRVPVKDGIKRTESRDKAAELTVTYGFNLILTSSPSTEVENKRISPILDFLKMGQSFKYLSNSI